MLYTKHNYLNKNFDYIVNQEIIEYDMQSAGFNLIKKYKLIEQSKIEWLETLPKKERQIQIGLLQRSTKGLTKSLNNAFVEGRKLFFEANKIDDASVLSIKKDAIVMLRPVDNLVFDNIVFAEKSLYSSYYRLNKMEFYFSPRVLDVKGIGDELLHLHEDYMLDFLREVFRLNEVGNTSYNIEYLKEFAHYYKERELDINYYRELSKDSLFRMNHQFLGDTIGMNRIGDVDAVDIRYNYINYVVPIISILT